MIRRPPRSTLDRSSAASDVYKRQFLVEETGERVAARHAPIIFITSNDEKDLPDAFLRRCLFHYIDFPLSLIHISEPTRPY